jgi:uncharacterized protein (DUF2147 family)
MKKNIVCIVALLFSMISYAQNKNIIGKWHTIHEETGKVISVVEIYEINNKIYGKVCEISNPKSRSLLCKNCPGEDKNKPIIGMTVIKGLQKKDNEYTDGEILDPNSGKLYKCYITLINQDKLKVRGYIGFSLFGRTQYWERVK